MTDGNKYPLSIQNLFKPKLPFKYLQPNDYPPQLRKTSNISPISNFKSYIEDYKRKLNNNKGETDKGKVKQPSQRSIRNSKHYQLKLTSDLKKQKRKESFNRQVDQWNDPDFLQTMENNGILKDPYKTIFLGRLPYELKEDELKQYFLKYGQIDSINIIKDLNGNSKGYGFLVFDQTYQAKQCVNDLCKTGLKLNNDKKILIDIERSRIIRNFKPRRLGGGEGGRGYKKLDKYYSIASTGRRMNIANNPNIQPPPPQHPSQKRPYQNQNSYNSHSHSHSHSYQNSHYQSSHSHHRQSSSSTSSSSFPTGPLSMKDKYAKYM